MTAVIVIGGGVALAFALALLALDKWQRAPQARPVEPVTDEIPAVTRPALAGLVKTSEDLGLYDDEGELALRRCDELDESEPDPVAPRRGAHRAPRSMRNRLATWRAAPALRLGRRRSLLHRPARRPRPALPPRPLMRGRAGSSPE